MNTVITNGQSEAAVLLKSKTEKLMMNRKDILMLHSAGVVRRISTRRIIHITDAAIKYVYFLQKGMIKISNIGENGEEVIKYFIKPGGIFGELNLLEIDEDSHEMAIAIEESEVCFIPVESVRQLMATNPAFRKSINQSIGGRIRKMEERMFSLMLKGVKDRILDFLKEFVVEFGQPFNGGYTAEFFITHDDIAKITTTSRQSVTTSLVDFKKRGLIDYTNRKLTVLNFQHS